MYAMTIKHFFHNHKAEGKVRGFSCQVKQGMHKNLFQKGWITVFFIHDFNGPLIKRHIDDQN